MTFHGSNILLVSTLSALTDVTLLPRLIASVVINKWETLKGSFGKGHQLIAGMIKNDKHSRVNAKGLSQQWNVGHQTAKNTLEATMQLRIRQAIQPFSCQSRTDTMSL
eukprot:2586657-Ditylum_brightwellii.AAC.1